MMETFSLVIEIINAVTSAAMLVIVLFGIQIGRRMLFKNETLYGKEAEDRYTSIEDKLPGDGLFYHAPYEGGNKITPQFEVERFRYDPQTMTPEWKDIAKIVRYYYTEKDEKDKIMVKSWRLKAGARGRIVNRAK